MTDKEPYLQLYNAMKASMPDDSIDAENYRVAVIDRLANEQAGPLWFVCSPNGSLEKIKKRYLRATAPAFVKYQEVYLVLDGRPITDHEAQVREYDTFGEKLVVLEAYLLSSLSECTRSYIASRRKDEAMMDQPSHQANLTSMARHSSVCGAQDLASADQMGPKPPEEAIVSKQQASNNKLGFNGDPSDSFDLATAFKSFRDDIHSSNLEGKEKAVKKCIALLKRINNIVSVHEDSLGLQIWGKRVNKICDDFHKPKTTIGLLGQTGAGKSSLINALLEEEQIVPTSGMQACTAAPIHIAFNDATTSTYRAEIEFIEFSEWERELKIFHEDVTRNADESPKKASSETASASAKVRAVHRRLNKLHVTEEDIDEAIDDVVNVLGKTEVVENNNAKEFHKSLRDYVFTAQKGSRISANDSARAVEELWPLVKVVRIYTKSPILATGAVLIDLPGLGDANAARANVARGHMQHCDFLWILSPIKRAVDDETAKKLLGASLNTQLVMDGSADKTTIICTGTDDILVADFSHLSALEELRQDIDRYDEKISTLEESIEALEEKIGQFEIESGKHDGQIAHLEKRIRELKPPDASSHKRKRSMSPTDTSSGKKQRTMSGGTIILDDDDSEDDAYENSGQVKQSHTLPKPDDCSESSEQLQAKIEELQLRKAELLNSNVEENSILKQNRIELEQLKLTVADARERLKSKCIMERNEICRERIRADYADCIRGFDEREEQQRAPDDFDPSIPLRDYDAIGNNLPVFCTSSIAYQKLKKRFSKDTRVGGFRNIDDTEIPALKAHCVQLTITSRIAACKQFLIEFCELASSMKLWAQRCENLEHMDSEGAKQREESIMSSLGDLLKIIEKAARSAMANIRSELNSHIYGKLPAAINQGLGQTTEVTEEWEHLRFNTYKATCRREGLFNGNDWNQALLDPVMTKLAPGWNEAFTTLIPKILNNLGNEVAEALQNFSREVDEALNHTPLHTGGEVLRMQVSNFKLSIENLCVATTVALNVSQREISREFKILIRNKMLDGYKACERLTGPGCYQKMKESMSQHIAAVERSMFEKSCEIVKHRLCLCADHKEEALLREVRDRIEVLRNDYMNAIGTFNEEADRPLRKRRRGVARSMMSVLCDSDQIRLKLPIEEPMQ